jgi:hypothetical protein
VTVLGAALTFGVTRSDNFSLAFVVPVAYSNAITVTAARMSLAFMFL